MKNKQADDLEIKKISEMILTAGPYISPKEIAYVADAAAYGWNNHWGDYLQKFQDKFASYLDVPHALATSSCTGAMHLALLAMGIGKGDEVIVPEITWISTAAVVTYTGATPVFCDVDPLTWTIDPHSVEKLITSRTKAIMPVHIYGCPCDMNPLWDLAKKHNLFILEDAAQSIGATYHGKKTGSLGDAAAFSFQGAKAVVTGEGGMLVTTDPELYKKAIYIGDHGRDPKKALFNTSIGYKYKMSNMQAALGLAQMESVEDIVNRKRQIFKWYQERIGDIEEIALNAEPKGLKNIYWMTSLVLPKNAKFTRDEFMLELKSRKVDSRPIFYPLSSMPMFSKQDNPNAYYVGLYGINLPSGHARTEEEIDYVCANIRDILGKSAGRVSHTQPSGWLEYREDCYKAIQQAKAEGCEIRFTHGDQEFTLESLSIKHLNDDVVTELLKSWREDSQEGFLDKFEVTLAGTQKWLEYLLTKAADRILFLVKDANGMAIGHVGLNRFNWEQKFCELDNIVRGVKNIYPGIMKAACSELMSWGKSIFKLKNIYLKVLSDNSRAIKIYHELHYKEISRVPLYKENKGHGYYSLRPLHFPEYEKVDYYFITMKCEKF